MELQYAKALPFRRKRQDRKQGRSQGPEPIASVSPPFLAHGKGQKKMMH